MAKERVPVPLSQRPSDGIFILMFVLMFIIAWTVDVISGISDVGSEAHGPGITVEKGKNAIWPPQFMYESTVWWCNLADPVFCYNPMWMKVMAAVSPFIYSPFYIAAIYAFVKGRDWIREVGLMYSWGLFFTLTVILAEEYAGEKPSHNFPVVLVGNFPYWILPLFLIARLWPKHPFTTTRLPLDKKKKNKSH